MFDEMHKALSDTEAQYADVRHEENNHLSFSLFNGAMKSSAMSDSRGGHVRVIAGARKAVGSYSAPEELGNAMTKVEKAARQMEALNAVYNGMAECEKANNSVVPEVEKHPRSVGLDEKIALARSYSDIAAQVSGVQGVDVSYREAIINKWFASSEGSKVFQEQTQVDLIIRITARDGNIVQDISHVIGGSPDYARLEGRHSEIEEKAALATKLLKASPAEAGIFTVILAPELTGVFIHEAFGHFSEADSLRSNPGMREIMALNRRIGSECLTVYDDPAIPGRPGSYAYDDEGVAGRRAILIDRGLLAGRLHSRETACEFDEPLTGHARAVSHRFTPIVRMGNICVDAGDKSLEELIGPVKNGYYAAGTRGGQTMGDQFTLGCQYARRIEDGKLGELVRDIGFSGNLFTTLMNVEAAGSEVVIPDGGGCGKGAQLLWRSGIGGPHIRIASLATGGI